MTGRVASWFPWISHVVVLVVSTHADTRNLLMIDDHDILYHAGTKRILEPLDRGPAVGKPALSATEPWEQLFGYVSPHKVGDQLYLYYQCYSTHGVVNGNNIGVCLATSSDNGGTFNKPGLGVFNRSGVPTNVVFSPSPSFYFGSILYEPDAKPSMRWKMIFWDIQTPAEQPTWKVPGLYTATSDDGIHWTQLSAKGVPAILGAYGGGSPMQPPLASQNASSRPSPTGEWNTELSESDAMNLMWDPVSSEYRVYSKTWIDGIDGGMFWKRAVMMHTSKDFVTWGPLPGHLCLAPDEFDVGHNPSTSAPYLPGGGSNGVELHAGPVVYLPGAQAHVMLIQLLDWSSAPNGGNLVCELGVSRGGGTTWSRPFRSHLGYPKFLDVNPTANQFDSGTLWTNGQMIASEDGKTQSFYYGAYEAWDVDVSGKGASGVGIVTMKTDRFAALTCMNISYPCQVTMKALDLSKVVRITANVDTTGTGSSLKVEILTAAGYGLDGYTKAHATTIAGMSDTNITVGWATKQLPLLDVHATVIIRAHLTGNAKLYAINLHTDSA